MMEISRTSLARWLSRWSTASQIRDQNSAMSGTRLPPIRFLSHRDLHPFIALSGQDAGGPWDWGFNFLHNEMMKIMIQIKDQIERIHEKSSNLVD